jgi:predicted enzyme related to lactoylglutathione lyase
VPPRPARGAGAVGAAAAIGAAVGTVGALGHRDSVPKVSERLQVVHVFAGIPTADYAAALPWYQRVMGRPPDILPNASEGMWTLSGGGSVYLVTDPEHSGGGVVTLAVADLDSLLARWSADGIEPARIDALSAGRKATLIDPEGNLIAFVQLVSS